MRQSVSGATDVIRVVGDSASRVGNVKRLRVIRAAGVVGGGADSAVTSSDSRS